MIENLVSFGFMKEGLEFRFTAFMNEVKKAGVELYSLVSNDYELVKSNEQNHFPIPHLGIELGICQGNYHNMELPWLRWWDNQGNL